ncbi:MAG: hypothetical protein ACHQ4J_13795 [Candidatus Binatia bacterium]
MSEPGWNPWKMATIGILVVFATALATGVVVAHYMGTAAPQAPDTQQLASANSPNPPTADAPAPAARDSAPPVPPPPAAQAPEAQAPPPRPPRHVAARPSTADIEDCNRYAASTHNGAAETLKDALVGGAAGAGLGAAGGAIADGGHGAGKGAGIGGLIGAAAGTLYGLNDANQQDSRRAAAYRACMHRRGYTD